MRSEPFAHAASILPGETSGALETHGKPAWSSSFLESATLGQAKEAKAKLDAAGIGASPDTGSNVWLVSGAKSESGRPMVASDPHLSLPSPSTFYELGIRARDLVLYGVTFPGTPSVVHGMNEHIAWGSTVNPTDVTDVFQETVVTSGGVPVATIFRGAARADADLPAELPGESARQRDPRRPGRRCRRRRACRRSRSRPGTGR